MTETITARTRKARTGATGNHRQSTPAVELNDVVKSFGNVTAVGHLSLTEQPGEVVALLGPNAAGKTTGKNRAGPIAGNIPVSNPPHPQFLRVPLIAIWLVFLIDPLVTAVRHPEPMARVAGVALLVVFVGLYVESLLRPHQWGTAISERPLPIVVAKLVAMLLCTVALVPIIGPVAMVCVVFVTAAAAATLPLRIAFAVAVILLIGTEVATFTVPGWQNHNQGFAVLLAGAATFAARVAGERTRSLVVAQRELGQAAVEQERARIAGDLHDILGHSLTVISLKAQLAARTLDDNPARARDEIEDIERLSRDALADVRTTALGIRGISLAGEIAEARAALAAAGIRAQLPGVVDEIESTNRELFAWTIREAVTNVIRHSDASVCTVELMPGRVTIRDNGVGPGSAAETVDPLAGHGLEGLRRRVTAAGGVLIVGTGPDGSGFSVEVTVPHD